MNQKAFLIAKEIVESEETFIRVLRLLNEVCSSSLHGSHLVIQLQSYISCIYFKQAVSPGGDEMICPLLIAVPILSAPCRLWGCYATLFIC